MSWAPLWSSRWDMNQRQHSTCAEHDTIRWLNVRYVADCLSTTHHIITDVLGYHKVYARWVPWILTPQNKQAHLTISLENLSLYNAYPAIFLCRYVTMDETWAYHIDLRPSYKVKHGKHTTSPPRHSTRLPSLAKLWHLYFGTVRVIDYLEKGKTVMGSGQLLRGINQKSSYNNQRKATGDSRVKVRCFITTMQQSTLLLLPQLLFNTAAPNCWITHHILQTWLHLTSTCSDLWKICYMDKHLRAMKLSLRPKMTGLNS